MIKTEHQETAMKRYFSGEEIEIGDHITTDGGEDHNVILKIIDCPQSGTIMALIVLAP